MPHDPRSTDPEFDPADAQAILADQPVVAQRLTVDGAVLFTAWGLAWVLGYAVLWFTGRTSPDGRATGWAFAVFQVLLAAAVVVTAVHIARRSRGVRGDSASAGAMYGFTWAFAFVAVSLVIGGMLRHGLDAVQVAALANAMACLVVGTLYMAGAAMVRDRSWFVLGAWIVLVGGVATALPITTLYLVMALAGGGGMLLAALVLQVGRHRARTAVPVSRPDRESRPDRGESS